MENYEEYMMLQADGELDEAGTEALQAFLEAYPELAEDMKLYESLHLEPDTAMVYTGKEALKPLPAKRTITPGWRGMAAAAGVAAVVCIAAWQYFRTGTGTGNDAETVADNNIPESHPAKSINNPAVAATTGPQIQTAPQPAVNTSHMAAVNKSSYKPLLHETAPVPQRDELAALQPLGAQPLRTENVAAGTITENTTELPIPATPEEKQDRRFLAWLPITEERKQGLEMVKDAIDQRIEQVRTLNNNIKETTLVLNIGKKGITLNF